MYIYNTRRYVETSSLPTFLYKTVRHIETRFPDWSTAYSMQSNKKNLWTVKKKSESLLEQLLAGDGAEPIENCFTVSVFPGKDDLTILT